MSEQCVSCATAGDAIPTALVRHHVTGPWRRDLENKEFSFCDAPGCHIVYFTVDGFTFTVDDVRKAPAYKTGDGSNLLCFCFDVTGNDTLSEPDPTPYIRERVRRQECACDVLNPSGKCCLGSIVRWRKEHS